MKMFRAKITLLRELQLTDNFFSANAGNLCKPLNDVDGALKCSMACIDKDYDDRFNKSGQDSAIFSDVIFVFFHYLRNVMYNRNVKNW